MPAELIGRIRPGTVRGGGVAAAAGQGPGQDAWFGLVEPPAGFLLGLVMPAAQRIQIAFASLAALVVRDRVVVVTMRGRAAAAGVAAPAVPDLDQVAQ